MPEHRGNLISIELTATFEDPSFMTPLSQSRVDTLVGFLAGGLATAAHPLVVVIDDGRGWAGLLLQVLDAVPTSSGNGVDTNPDATT